MNIIRIDEQTIADGKRAYRDYLGAMLCGPQSPTYDGGMRRETGVQVVVGAITACIEQGLTTRHEIADAVSRVSLCRRSTIRDFLDALSGNDPTRHLWGVDGIGDYYDLQAEHDRPGGCAGLLIAA